MTRAAILASLALAAGCGDSAPSAPVASGANAAGSLVVPTFAGDVAEIVYGSCTPCHRPGGPTPFSLLDYDDVRKRRKQIVEVTGDRLMPPWLPTHGDFIDDRRLREDQIVTLRRWAEGGAPRGDVAIEPPCPEFPEGWQLREPDLIVAVEQEIVVPASGVDIIRNFVIPVAITSTKFVEAVEIQPGSPAVHHAVLAVDATRESRRIDALDAEPGFAGMLVGNAKPPDGHFIGWTPGKRVRPNAEGMAWRLMPGHDLLLQLHLTTTGKRETLRPRIGLYFTDVAPSVVTYPLVLFCEQIDVPAGATDYVVKDHFVTPVAVTVHSIYPHAHYICRRMVATLTPPGGKSRDLFRIDRWDFDWQDDYSFREPIRLPAGTRIDFEYSYDNSADNPHNPISPPRRVQFGQQSTDEMATLTLQLTTADLDARRVLGEASLRRDLEKVGFNASLMLQLAGLLRETGKNDESMALVSRVREREPENATALLELGACLEFEGRVAEAENAYIQCLSRDPGQNVARIQLANILARSGRAEPAIALYEEALTLSPQLAALHNNLATAYFATSRLDLAARHYQQTVTIDPGYFRAWFNMGRVLGVMGRKDEARDALLRAQQLQPGAPEVAEALRDLQR